MIPLYLNNRDICQNNKNRIHKFKTILHIYLIYMIYVYMYELCMNIIYAKHHLRENIRKYNL